MRVWTWLPTSYTNQDTATREVPYDTLNYSSSSKVLRQAFGFSYREYTLACFKYLICVYVRGRYHSLSHYVVLILSKPDMWKPDFKDVCISFKWIKVVQNQKEAHKKTSTIKFTVLDFIRTNAKRQLMKRLPKLGCEWILSGYMQCIQYMWYPLAVCNLESVSLSPTIIECHSLMY